VFYESLIFRSERGREVAIDVEFAGDLPANKYRRNDFRLGLDGARQVARIISNIVDDHSFAAGGGGAADSLVQRNAGVGRHRTLKRA